MSPRDVRLVIVSGSTRLGEIYGNFFRSAGLRVEGIFQSAEELLSYVKLRVQENLTNILILYDHSSLEEDSIGTLRQVKEISRNCKIIVLMSRFNAELEREFALFDGVLFKPFTIKELFAQIESLAWNIER